MMITITSTAVRTARTGAVSFDVASRIRAAV